MRQQIQLCSVEGPSYRCSRSRAFLRRHVFQVESVLHMGISLGIKSWDLLPTSVSAVRWGLSFLNE